MTLSSLRLSCLAPKLPETHPKVEVQVHKETIAAKTKEYRVTIDKHTISQLEGRAEKKLPCECGMLIRRDWLSRHKLSLHHQEQMKML